MAAKEPAAEKQKTAMKHLKEAQSRWAAIRARYQNNPPMKYARDGKFRSGSWKSPRRWMTWPPTLKRAAPSAK